MSDAAVTFLAWVRPPLGDLITGPSDGHARAAAQITLTELDGAGTAGATATEAVTFLVAGPADVVGLQPGAVVRRYPSPGTLDHESNRCPYVELADSTLPWRYTPAPTPAGPALHPWLVLIVGQEGGELALEGDRVTLQPSAQQGVQAVAGPTSPYRFAHVQDAGGVRTTRVLSARPLSAGVDYLAVLVPAFDAAGAPAWTGAAPVTVPVFDGWRFRTAVPAGSFEQLARLLEPGDAPASTGTATLHYPRLAGAPPLTALGALVGRTADGAIAEEPLPAEVQSDMASLRLPARDPQGRPIVALPRYGDAWDADAPAWGEGLNTDPRHRGVAGLGLSVAIDLQEDLVENAVTHLGALQEARQAVRQLTLGLAATRSLWQRRVPADPSERLWLLGPALSRLVTPNGTVAQLATAEDRTVAAGTFSAAARRILRRGPARTALAATAPTPAQLLSSVNRTPPALPAGIDGLPLSAVQLGRLDSARAAAITAQKVNTAALMTAADQLAAGTATELKAAAAGVVTSAKAAAKAGKPVAWAPLLATLAAGDAGVLAQARDRAAVLAVLRRGIAGLASTAGTGVVATQPTAEAAGPIHPVDPGGGVFAPPGSSSSDDVLELLAALAPLQAQDPVPAPIAVDALASAVASAFAPVGAAAPAAVRVLSTIPGAVDPAQPLAPPELCVGLERPAWRDLGAEAPEWLLPGVGELPDNAVIALESNPIFLDAYLTGLNTQLLAELRWRNIPVATGCTPLRRFWGRTDPSSGQPADDIVGVADWASASALGDAGHRAPGTTGRELVIAVRGELFRRYPTTLVYLQSAAPAGFGADPDPDGARLMPAFTGQIGADVFFFGFPGVDETALAANWLVLEERPSGYRFANDLSTTAATGHEWAAATLVQPVRVLIRGDSLGVGAGS